MDAFRRKARLFLKPHENHIAVLKVKRNEPLTPTDLKELERIFLEAGVDEAALERAASRRRARPASSARLSGSIGRRRSVPSPNSSTAAGLSRDQLEFLDLVIDHLTARGVMDPKLLYESPVHRFRPMGVEGVFDKAETAKVIEILRDVRKRAAA